VLSALVGSVPDAWEVRPAARAAWIDFLSRRATFVAETVVDELLARCPPGRP